jgi:hypothetical protein
MLLTIIVPQCLLQRTQNLYTGLLQIFLSMTRMYIYRTLQMKGWWEYNINVWFRFMYSQKCTPRYFQNYNVLSPNFRIHVSVSDLYIPRIGLPILQQPNRQTDPENTEMAHRYMKVGTGNEAVPFQFREYRNRFFRAVYAFNTCNIDKTIK